MISPSQRPLPDNTQHSQQTNIHAPGGIRTHNLSRRAAKDLRLRPCGHWDRLFCFLKIQILILFQYCFCVRFEIRSTKNEKFLVNEIPNYKSITNLMHWLLFIHKILFSSTCFEHQVLISCVSTGNQDSYGEWRSHMLLVYNYVLLKMSTWCPKHVEENSILWINNNQCIKLVINVQGYS